MASPSEHPAPRRFGPYPEDAAQDAIWRELDPDAFADDDADAAVPSAGTARPDAAPSEKPAIDPVEFIRARRDAQRARDPLAESSAEDILLARIAALRSNLAERDAECELLRSTTAEATKKIAKHAGDLWSAYRDGFLDSACRVNTDVLPMEEVMALVDERASDYIARRREP